MIKSIISDQELRDLVNQKILSVAIEFTKSSNFLDTFGLVTVARPMITLTRTLDTSTSLSPSEKQQIKQGIIYSYNQLLHL